MLVAKRNVKKASKKIEKMPTISTPLSSLRIILDALSEDKFELLGAQVGPLQGSVTEFPECCAFDIVSGLQIDPKPAGVSERAYRAFLCKNLVEEIVAPFILCTTAATQREVEAGLPKIGFKKILSVINPNTKNKVTLWLGNTRH